MLLRKAQHLTEKHFTLFAELPVYCRWKTNILSTFFVVFFLFSLGQDESYSQSLRYTVDRMRCGVPDQTGAMIHKMCK